MNILITGGAGMVGSHIARRVMNENKIMVVDNLETGREDNIPDGPYIYFEKIDIADRPRLAGVFCSFQPDIVVHAAASYKDPNNWERDTQTNCLGTSHIAKLSDESGVKRIIYFQTSLCYGLKPLEQPITLNHSIRPEGSSYAITKTFSEQILSLAKTPVITFRLANCCGDAGKSGPIPAFYKRIKAGQRCKVAQTRRDFIYVEDLVDVVERAIMGEGKNQAYHVSSGSDVSIEEVYKCVATAMGVSISDYDVLPPNADDVATILLDPSKTEKDFPGWKTKTPIQETVRKAIEWYEQYGLEDTFTHLKEVNK